MTTCTLYEVNEGKQCKVIAINGGNGLITKLDNLGIRLGKEIVKINNSFFGGPIAVKVDNIKIAIGKNMANKIIVEADR